MTKPLNVFAVMNMSMFSAAIPAFVVLRLLLWG
jgi:hypothetical protein